jgi:hypothetical protein
MGRTGNAGLCWGPPNSGDGAGQENRDRERQASVDARGIARPVHAQLPRAVPLQHQRRELSGDSRTASLWPPATPGHPHSFHAFQTF